LKPRSTVIVTPRERYSPTLTSLRSLFATLPVEVPVIVIDGAFPEPVRRDLAELQLARPFRVAKRDWPLIPNEARNIGTAMAETEFIVFSDNDMEYEPGWLEALEAHADRTGADVVAPLICIGPPAATIIHHAGGILSLTRDSESIRIREKHNLMNRPIEELAAADLPEITDTGEFHSVFVRTEFMRKLGPLDERLITREQNDFALRIRHAGGRVGFERRAIVTYNAKTPLRRGDLEYHVFRWNPVDALNSIETLESVWGFHFHRRRILRDWIQRHRRARITEEYAQVSRWTGKRLFEAVIAPFIERSILKRAYGRRPQTRLSAPELSQQARKEVLNYFLSRQTQAESSQHRKSHVTKAA
jgi:GT2 family glycosyltransferase